MSFFDTQTTCTPNLIKKNPIISIIIRGKQIMQIFPHYNISVEVYCPREGVTE